MCVSVLVISDSKFKSQEVMPSVVAMTTLPANQMSPTEDSPANEKAAHTRTSLMEFSASKALNWLTGATMSRKTSGDDISDSKLQTSDKLSKTSVDLNGCRDKFDSNLEAKEKSRKSRNPKPVLTEPQKKVYSDARLSNVDVDPFIPQNESLRSSTSSMTGFSAIFTALSARLGENFVNQSNTSLRSCDQTSSQSLSQSMTSSATSLMSRLTGLNLGASPSQKTYKKGKI